MTDQELIRAAKKWREDYYLNGDHIILLDALIDRLADLQSENAELHRDAEREHERYIETLGERDGFEARATVLGAALARVEAERDAAYEAICDHCDYIPCRREACMWWRGAQGEG